MHSFVDALIDFEKAGDMDASDDYVRFRIWLVRARLGDKKIATDDLANYWERAQKRNPNDWPSMVERFLTGQMDERELFCRRVMTRPPPIPGPDANNARPIFYAGEKRLIDGDNPVAQRYFKNCLATGEKDFTEYHQRRRRIKIFENVTIARQNLLESSLDSGFHYHQRRDGRVAEGDGLLNRYTVKSRIGGSNPPLSASFSLQYEATYCVPRYAFTCPSKYSALRMSP